MGGTSKRSKKLSDGNGDPSPKRRPEDDFIVFLDENLHRCQRVLSVLESRGVTCERYCDHFNRPGLPDQEWLPIVGRNGWFLLSTDKSFRYNELERQELNRSPVGVFQFSKNQYGAQSMASALATALCRMKRIAKRVPRPFVASINKSGNVTVLWPKGL